MTARKLLKELSQLGDLSKDFSYPYVKLRLSDSAFEGLTDIEREARVAEKLGLSIEEIRRTAHNNLFLFEFLAPNEHQPGRTSRSTHWLAGLTEVTTVAKEASIRAIHFYGYKGGQARSTILAALSVALAKDGWKVLVIDADLEAPSLDTIFSTTSRTLSSTLLGLSQGREPLNPVAAYSPSSGTGGVDLLNCWPRTESYDIDSAALALRAALEPTILEQSFAQISQYALANSYNAVLVDHRTGLSPSVLPCMSALPGPVVATVRLDEQWQPAAKFIELLMKTFPREPGLFAVWKPDSEDERSFAQRTFRQREHLLEILVDAYESSFEEGSEELATTDLEDHIVTWPYDEAFRSNRLPEPESLAIPAREALTRIRSLLGLGGERILPSSVGPSKPQTSHPSGAQDEGDFITTGALRELLKANNPYTYILGRKGTGKTRLARELATRKIGEPLLVPADAPDQLGLISTSAEIRDAATRLTSTPDQLWLSLFTAAVQLPNTNRSELMAMFERETRETRSVAEHVKIWAQSSKPRSFLLDSFETAFTSKQMVPLLSALFPILSMIESDSRSAEQINFRLFLRQDLVQQASIQNVEQQLFGKKLELSWDYQSILNFTLSRIAITPWFAQHFPALIGKIQEVWGSILTGDLQILRCEELLLLAFPTTVRRNNLRMTTFFKTYFADTATERAPINSPAGTDTSRYYPRVFQEFIRTIPDDLRDRTGQTVKAVDTEGKIHQERIFKAHEKAADSYLQDLKQELVYVIDLAADESENRQLIDRLLKAFEGRTTPFSLDEMVEDLSSQTEIAPKEVRAALERLKEVGMFEVRPDYPGQWRVGRLFKSSLRLKYKRSSA